MSETLTVTELRSRLYTVIDQVIETGIPQRVRRGDSFVVIQPEEGTRRLHLDRLPRRQAITCTVDELVDQTFEDEWRGDL